MVELLNDWGLEIARNVIEVNARRLDGPTLLFSSSGMDPKSKIGPDFTRDAERSVYDPVS